MKRQEIDLELEALRRETTFTAVELRKIVDLDHDEVAFEGAFLDQLHSLKNHPDLSKFDTTNRGLTKVVEPVQLCATLRSRSENHRF